MSKDRIRGTGAVYGFTLRQIVRNKANMITMGIMLICIAGAIPVMSFFSEIKRVTWCTVDIPISGRRKNI